MIQIAISIASQQTQRQLSNISREPATLARNLVTMRITDKKDKYNRKQSSENNNYQKNVKFIDTSDLEDEMKMGSLRISESGSSKFVNYVLLEEVEDAYNVFTVSENQPVQKTELVVVQIADKHITKECDTGSCATLCSVIDYKRYFADIALEKLINVTDRIGESYTF
jgi:hypothetical protein